jgi:hypothetical protein
VNLEKKREKRERRRQKKKKIDGHMFPIVYMQPYQEALVEWNPTP